MGGIAVFVPAYAYSTDRAPSHNITITFVKKAKSELPELFADLFPHMHRPQVIETNTTLSWLRRPSVVEKRFGMTRPGTGPGGTDVA